MNIPVQLEKKVVMVDSQARGSGVVDDGRQWAGISNHVSILKFARSRVRAGFGLFVSLKPWDGDMFRFDVLVV